MSEPTEREKLAEVITHAVMGICGSWRPSFGDRAAESVLAWMEQEGYRKPRVIEGRSPCQQCGSRDGLDAVVPDSEWPIIHAYTGGKNLLCLWCLDAAYASLGVKGRAVLHFAGAALHATSEEP